MNKQKEAHVANKIHQILLSMMLTDLKEMLNTKTTWGVNRKKNKPLSEEELSEIEEIVFMLQRVLMKIATAPAGETVPVPMASICTCSIHLKYFDQIRLATIDDLNRIDPMVLLDWLHEAELQKGAKRQYHLYTRMRFRAEDFAKELANKA